MDKLLAMTTAVIPFLLLSTPSSSMSSTPKFPEASFNVNNITTAVASAFSSAASASFGLPMMNSSELLELDELEYIFDRRYVRIIFIVLYTIVFCFCFFGNLMVILVVTLHWKMSQTKILLANLAFADLTVGLFCVFQNLSLYIMDSWMFGQFLCKMYHFVNSLSHTASILILVLICVERYMCILHPFKCKELLTIKRLWLLIAGVWLASAVYSSPKLYYIGTLKVLRMDGEPEIICTAKRTLYDSRTFDICHFFLLFLLPLVSMSIMYFRVGVVLWTTSQGCLVGTSPPGNVMTTNHPSPCPYPHMPKNHHKRPSIHMRIFRNPTKDIDEDLAHYLQTDYEFQLTRQRQQQQQQQQKYNNHSNNNPMSKNGINKKYLMDTHELKLINMVNINESPRSGSRDFTTSTLTTTMTTGPGVKGHNCLVHSHRCSSASMMGESIKNGHHQSSGGGCHCRHQRGIFRGDSVLLYQQQQGQGRSSKCSQAKNVRGGKDALRIRRSVIKMLLVILLVFAVCHLPTHMRKMFLYFSPNFSHFSITGTLATPICNLIMYSNSALNPVIYSFLSKSFRTSFAALLKCKNSLELPNNEIASTSEVLNLKSVAGGQDPDKIHRQGFRSSGRRNRVEFANQI